MASSIINSDDGVISGTSGLKSTGGDDGVLNIQNNGTTAVTVDASGNVGVGTASPAVAMDVVGQVRASTGILFGSDTAAANALDDYEEGTWTPVLTDDIGNAFSMSGATVGTYTKIGNLVTVIAYCVTTGVGSASGDVRLTGLPFTVENSDARGAVTVGNASSLALGTAGFSVTGLVVPATTYIYFYIWDAITGTASRLSTTTHSPVATMIMSCTYRV